MAEKIYAIGLGDPRARVEAAAHVALDALLQSDTTALDMMPLSRLDDVTHIAYLRSTEFTLPELVRLASIVAREATADFKKELDDEKALWEKNHTRYTPDGIARENEHLAVAADAVREMNAAVSVNYEWRFGRMPQEELLTLLTQAPTPETMARLAEPDAQLAILSEDPNNLGLMPKIREAAGNYKEYDALLQRVAEDLKNVNPDLLAAVFDEIADLLHGGEPGHEGGHRARDFVHAAITYLDPEHLGQVGFAAALVSVIGGGGHDLGTAFFERYAEAGIPLSHAEIGAVVWQTIAQRHGLPDSLTHAVALGIAAHTNYLEYQLPSKELPIVRGPYFNHPVLDTIRIIDRDDCNGPALVFRHMIAMAYQIALEKQGGDLQSGERFVPTDPFTLFAVLTAQNGKVERRGMTDGKPIVQSSSSMADHLAFFTSSIGAFPRGQSDNTYPIPSEVIHKRKDQSDQIIGALTDEMSSSDIAIYFANRDAILGQFKRFIREASDNVEGFDAAWSVLRDALLSRDNETIARNLRAWELVMRLYLDNIEFMQERLAQLPTALNSASLDTHQRELADVILQHASRSLSALHPEGGVIETELRLRG